MIKDIQPAANQWVDVYAMTGIAVGTGLLVQAKTDTLVYLWEGSAEPVLGAQDWKMPGYEVDRKRGPVRVRPGATGLWAYAWNPLSSDGKGVLCVQEDA